jgi:Ca-activated chloride channel family protein
LIQAEPTAVEAAQQENPMNTDTKNNTLMAPLVAVVLGALIVWAPHAAATGLLAENLMPGFGGMEEGTPADQLVTLTDLIVEVEMNESGAVIHEYRTYGIDWNVDASGADLTFFRPLGEGDSIEDLYFNGQSVEGTILNIEEADALRRSLVKKLREPGPLGEMGTRLFVSDTIELGVEPWGLSVTIGFTVHQPLSQRSTMRGVDIPVDWHKTPVGFTSVSVTATGEEPVRALYAPYHNLAIERLSATQVSGTYVGYERCTGFPITLLMSTGTEPVHLDLLPYRYNAEEGGRFLALISPSLSQESGAVAARDFVLVVDRSGSMKGEKMTQARDALTAVMDGLNPVDSFNIVIFDDGIETFATDNQKATEDVKKDAAAFIDAVVADGSTNIFDAVQTGLGSFPTQTGNPRYLVLLTDGEATAGETNTDAILAMAQSHNEVGARIFTFGIGYNVNTILLDKLASESSGDALYIPPGAPVDVAVQGFFAQIVDPMLTDPVLDAQAFGVDFLQPTVLGDLFAGQTTTLLGRYAKPGKGQIVLSGRVGADDVMHVFDVELPEFATSEGYVPRIWATRQVGELLQQLKLSEAGEGVVDEVLALAERFGVVTEFTYFQVDEDGNAKMVYSDVPVASSGAVAVNTSTSIDGYQKGGTVSQGVDTYVRYAWDRTLPIQDGWFTDTSLAGSDQWIDLTFGSDAHLALAEAEAKLGIGAFLALSTDVKFEHMGRAFRITDGKTEDGPYAPTETLDVPTANGLPGHGEASVTYVGDEPTPSEETVEIEILGPEEVVAIIISEEKPESTLGPKPGSDDPAGCSAGSTGAPVSGWVVILMVTLLGMATRRRMI